MGQKHTIITADQPLYSRGYELVWANPKFAHVIFIMGGLHICFNFQKATGKHMGNAGLDDAWTEAGVNAAHTTDAMLDGKAYYRAVRGHQLTYEVLWHIKWPMFGLWLADNGHSHEVDVQAFSSSSLGSRCVPWLGEGLSMSSPNDPVLCCPLPYRVAPVFPVFVQVVSPPLGWSPLTSFLVIWSPSGDARGPSVVFEAVDIPCPGPFHFSHSVDYIYEFCPLPNPDVGPSIFVCDVEHTSFHFGLCGRKFILCLFGQCPGLCTICHSWQHTGVVHLSFQADGKVAFEDIPVFGVCRPACHDSSLYLFFLVLLLEAVVLSQVQVAWDIFYQHIVHVYRGVVYNHHLCLCDVHLKTHLSTFIG